MTLAVAPCCGPGLAAQRVRVCLPSCYTGPHGPISPVLCLAAEFGVFSRWLQSLSRTGLELNPLTAWCGGSAEQRSDAPAPGRAALGQTEMPGQPASPCVPAAARERWGWGWGQRQKREMGGPHRAAQTPWGHRHRAEPGRGSSKSSGRLSGGAEHCVRGGGHTHLPGGALGAWGPLEAGTSGREAAPCPRPRPRPALSGPSNPAH